MRSASVPLGGLRSRLRTMLGRYRYGVAMLDQVALSIFGFALNLALVRALSATDYGTVALWMTIGLLAIAIQNALVNTPLSTHVPTASTEAGARRLGEAIAVVNLLTIALVAGLVAVVIVATDAEWAPDSVTDLTAIALFVAAGMYREFYRSLAFSRNDMGMLLWTDGPYLAVTTLCLAAIFVWPGQFANLAAAFFAMSAGCIAARFALIGRFAVPAAHPLRPGWWRDYRQIRNDAGWALVGVLTTHLHGRSYVYVVVNMVGLAGLAAINVVGLLFRPVRIIATSWGRTALPDMAAHLAAGRIGAFDRVLVQGLLAAAAGSAGWVVVLWLGWGAIETHVFAGQYPDSWLLVWPWALAAGLDAIGHVVSIGVRAARDFKFLAYVTVLTAPVTIGATAGAILWQGLAWAMYGVALGNLVTLTVEGGRLLVLRRRVAAGGAASGPASDRAAVATTPTP